TSPRPSPPSPASCRVFEPRSERGRVPPGRPARLLFPINEALRRSGARLTGTGTAQLNRGAEEAAVRHPINPATITATSPSRQSTQCRQQTFDGPSKDL